VQHLQRIGQYLTSPGITDEIITIYVAAADARRAGGVHGLASEAEDIKTQIVKREEGLAKADRGEVLNIVTQVALLWFARHGAELRQRWIASDAEVAGRNGQAH
jgi:ADP-ribose pyrophosphatase